LCLIGIKIGYKCTFSSKSKFIIFNSKINIIYFMDFNRNWYWQSIMLIVCICTPNTWTQRIVFLLPDLKARINNFPTHLSNQITKQQNIYFHWTSTCLQIYWLHFEGIYLSKRIKRKLLIVLIQNYLF
jgi:hypothetical protein